MAKDQNNSRNINKALNALASPSRRTLLGSLALGCVSPSILANVSQKQDKILSKNTTLLSAQGSNTDNYSLSWFGSNELHHSIHNTKVQFRGHGITLHPNKANRAIMFARRPGSMGVEVDLVSGEVIQQFHCAKHHHLTGHGCFSHDGSMLITSESNYETGQGHIVIRDTKHYQIQKTYPSFGIGPHEIKLLHNENILVIANGGILTHPDSGRKKLNLDSMKPNLTYFDLAKGKRVSTVEYHESKASIRHIDISQDNTVAIGLQMQRFKGYHDKTIALCATHKLGANQINPLDTTKDIYQHLNDYVGSVCVSPKHDIAGFTSPRGNLVLFWHLSKQQLINAFRFQDVCGIALDIDKTHFVLSNSSGHIRYIRTTDLTENTQLRQSFTGYQFDNHLVTI